MCNCIDEFNKLIRESSGDPEGRVKVSFRINRATNKMTDRPSMYCIYRDKKKDGTFSKEHDHLISGEYCPFCGKAYNEAASPREDGKGGVE